MGGRQGVLATMTTEAAAEVTMLLVVMDFFVDVLFILPWLEFVTIKRNVMLWW